MSANTGPNRQPSQPGAGAVRGGISGTLAAFVSMYIATELGDAAIGAACGGVVVAIMTATGKWLRNRGGPLGEILGQVL